MSFTFDNLQDIDRLLDQACNKLENRDDCDKINNSLYMIKYGRAYMKRILTPIKYEIATDLIKYSFICGVSIKKIAEKEKWSDHDYHNIKKKVFDEMVGTWEFGK